jgi:hypothetical protein
LDWCRKNEQYLYHRRPVANVAILWNQRNADYYGGPHVRERVGAALRGIVMALTRAGIPFLPIHTADMAEQLDVNAGFNLAILPELAVLGDDEIAGLEAFARRGGSVFAIGAVGIMANDGKTRRTPPLGKLLGIEYRKAEIEAQTAEADWENPVLHNYLRIEKPAHAIFAGFEKTATLPMGGTRQEINATAGTRVLATYIPPYPIYPPEFAWTDIKRTGEAVITEYTNPAGGKAVYAAWDLDAGYGRAAHPDHGDLIGNIVTYLLDDSPGIKISCNAYIDFKCYWQDKSGSPGFGRRLIVHLINGNHTGFAQGYGEENIPVGPITITVEVGKIPALNGFKPASAFATVDGAAVTLKTTEAGSGNAANGTANGVTLTLEKLGIHQLIVVE